MEVARDPNTDMPVEYQYTHLENNNTLRLFELSPQDSRLHGRIVHVPMGSCQYEALSYTWGDPSDGRDRIIIPQNGQNTYLYVGHNLLHALYLVRHQKKTRRIWIDAICINQNDVEERNQIVPRMFEIYSGATTVLISLGREEYYSERVPRAVFAINKSLAMNDAADGFPLLNQTASGQVDWMTFRIFLALRKWFTRAWVVQEAAAAVQSTFLCGEWEIPGTDLFDTLGELARYRLPDAIANVEDGWDHGVNAALQQLRFMRILGAGNKTLRRQPLITLLKRSRASAATSPADKIYAFLGMALDRNLPSVDYREPWQATYTRFAIHLIRKGHLSDILLNCFQDQDSSDLPSWVPNWASRVSEDSDRKNLLVQYHSPGMDTAGYQAGGKGFPSYSLDETIPPILSVHGLPFMKIEKKFSYQSPFASHWDPKQSLFNDPMRILAALEAIQEALQQTITDPETLELATFKTLLCDQHWRENRPLAPTDWSVFHAFLNKWAWTLDTFDPNHPTKFAPDKQPSPGRAKRLRESLCFYRNHAKELEDLSLKEKGRLSLEKEIGEFVRKAIFCLRLEICRSNLGAVGMVPWRAKEGDMVAVFAGVPVPFVLHPEEAEQEQSPSGRSYKLIGSCYFAAVMGGQVADGLQDHSEMIRLR